MNWFAKFEKKFSKYAIKNLMFYIIVLYAIGFVMNTFFNGLYDAYFSLDFAMIFKGQVWRLITFILQHNICGICAVFLLSDWFGT